MTDGAVADGAPHVPPTDEASIQVVSGSPTDEETAAIAALFTHLATDRSASALALPTDPPRSAWDRSTRPIRAPFGVDKDWRDR